MNHIWSEAELDAMLASKVKKRDLRIKTARVLFIFEIHIFTLYRPHGVLVGVVGDVYISLFAHVCSMATHRDKT